MTKKFKPCSVEGCARNAHSSAKGASGLCRAHYHRLYRYGSPTGGRTALGEPLQWLISHIGNSSDECINWPFSKLANGYGVVQVDGVRVLAHREMCRRAHGEAPTEHHEAAHSCGKGHLGCVNKSHLRWATHAENMSEIIVHGTHTRGERQPMHKLTRDEVIEIRSRYARGNVSQALLAKSFGVCQTQIGRILRGERWAWLDTCQVQSKG